MIFHVHTPSGFLGRYVESLTSYSGYNPDHRMEKLLPDASVNLVIALDEIRRYTFNNDDLTKKTKCIKAWVSGMQTSFITLSAEKNSSMFVIRFRPGGSYPFFHMPTDELNNLVIDAELIFGREILSLRDQLMEAGTCASQFRLVEQWLLQRIRTEDLAESVVGFAVARINATGPLDIPALVSKTGYSQKHVIHLFKRHVGLTLKLFHRVVRFNRVLHEIDIREEVDWSTIVHDCGFYDQAHFVNEFSHFSGINPTRYLTERGVYPNYVPISAKR